MAARNKINQFYHYQKTIETDYVFRFDELIPKGVRIKNLDFHFVDDETLYDINVKYLNHAFYTDIITFDYSKGNSIRGEVWISVERVIDNAGSAVDFKDELKRVCVHGLLHLLGYKDSSEMEKKTKSQPTHSMRTFKRKRGLVSP